MSSLDQCHQHFPTTRWPAIMSLNLKFSTHTKAKIAPTFRIILIWPFPRSVSPDYRPSTRFRLECAGVPFHSICRSSQSNTLEQVLYLHRSICSFPKKAWLDSNVTSFKSSRQDSGSRQLHGTSCLTLAYMAAPRAAAQSGSAEISV